MTLKFWDEVIFNVSCGDKDALFIVWMFNFDTQFGITSEMLSITCT